MNKFIVTILCFLATSPSFASPPRSSGRDIHCTIESQAAHATGSYDVVDARAQILYPVLNGDLRAGLRGTLTIARIIPESVGTTPADRRRARLAQELARLDQSLNPRLQVFYADGRFAIQLSLPGQPDAFDRRYLVDWSQGQRYAPAHAQLRKERALSNGDDLVLAVTCQPGS